MAKKLTQDEFIERATAKHGGYYTYKNPAFDKASDKVTITCPVHGDFPQSVSKHLSGQGCRICRRKDSKDHMRMSPEEFIERATAKHGGYYTYNKPTFRKTSDKVVITCPIHGDFPQAVKKHISGQGCSTCRRKASKDYMRITPEIFLNKAVAKHKNLYTYGVVECNSSRDYVEVICSVHGPWKQNVNNHLMGQGCPTCAGKNITTTDMVERFNNVHGDVYDYSLVKYANAITSVKIICRQHGAFEQMPYTHLDGSGCPDCAEYGFNKNKPAILYVYNCKSFIGFGISNEFETRHSKHLTNFKKAGVIGELIYSEGFSGSTALYIETSIKRYFKNSIINTGIEGFKTEALPIDYISNLLDFIKENALKFEGVQ